MTTLTLRRVKGHFVVVGAGYRANAVQLTAR